MLTLRVSDPDPIVLGLGEEQEAVLTAEPAVYVSIADYYEGPYTVTPGTEAITLETDGFTMSEDVTVQAVPVGSEGVPVATKGAVSNHQIAVTPSVTNTAGLIEGGTRTGAPVTVSASELVSGTYNVTSAGTKDVTNYASASVPSGSAGTPTASKVIVPEDVAAVITPSVTNSTGYITGGTKTGSNVVVTARELVSGNTLTCDGAGDWDVAEIETFTVPSGSIIQGYINGDFDDENNTRVWYPRFDFEAYGLFSGFDSFANMGYYLAVPANTTVTPTESAQTVGGNGYMMEGAVTVLAIPSNYVGSGITRRSSSDLTESGATVTAPAGYYSEGASKAVASGTEGTPTATKSAVNNHALTVTPSVINGAGYISGGTHSGTAVSVTAAELVSGTYNVTSSGTKDVTNYASASVPAGSATPAATISGTSATVSTGTNTITLSKTVSNTPQVSAGYVASGTTGNSSVSLTANVTTKGTATITPGTTNQTISSGTYITGTQTISGDANLVAGNIKSGTTIFGVTGTYSGGGGGDSKNAQTIQSTTRTTSTSYTKLCGDLTVSKTGTYDVYWTSFRSSTSGTWGTQLYIGSTAYGTAQATFSNHCQIVHLSNVSLTANQKISVYGRSRGSNYYAYVGQLSIIEA